MDFLSDFIDLEGLNIELFLEASLIAVLGSFLLGLVGRVIFGKRSGLNHAVSAAVGILFIYAASVALYSAGAEFRATLSPLPFVEFQGDNLVIFSFAGADFPAICSNILSMIILAFLINLVDTWLPDGKGLFSWLFFRCLTVAVGMLLHLAAIAILYYFVPEGIWTYAPAVLLGILVVTLAVGALKLLVGVAIASVNPIIGALYTFFFATLVGKELSKAILTTGLLCALVYALNSIGVTVISIASAALIAYLPLLIILAIVWYLVHQVL